MYDPAYMGKDRLLFKFRELLTLRKNKHKFTPAEIHQNIKLLEFLYKLAPPPTVKEQVQQLINDFKTMPNGFALIKGGRDEWK